MRRVTNFSWKLPVMVIALGVLIELIDLPIGNVKNHNAASYKIGGAVAGLGAVIFVIGVILLVIWVVGLLVRRRRTAPAGP
jgi:uncharacterized membrane protein